MVSAAALIAQSEDYLLSRTGCYEWRCERYGAAAAAMLNMGLDDNSLVVDVGAGWTELDAFLRTEFGWRGRYWPVDGMFDGTDLNHWVPPRPADFFVALEVLEHLHYPQRLLGQLRFYATKGVIVSVPNPRTTDVLGMDPTHVSVITEQQLRQNGFRVDERSFYGSPNDSLFGVYRRR